MSFREDCEHNIEPLSGYALSWGIGLALAYPDVEWDRLRAIIEDHIVERCGDDDDEGRRIDWPAVWEDWEK